jgi:hypothetical protein
MCGNSRERSRSWPAWKVSSSQSAYIFGHIGNLTGALGTGCHATFKDFREAILDFLRVEVPRKWSDYCDEASDNFQISDPKHFRVLG